MSPAAAIGERPEPVPLGGNMAEAGVRGALRGERRDAVEHLRDQDQHYELS